MLNISRTKSLMEMSKDSDNDEELGEPKPTILELAKVLAMKLEVKLEEFLSGV